MFDIAWQEGKISYYTLEIHEIASCGNGNQSVPKTKGQRNRKNIIFYGY